MDTPFKFCHNFPISPNVNPAFHFPILMPDCDALNSDIFDLILATERDLCPAEALPQLRKPSLSSLTMLSVH